ncbi:MAG: hypothetical protein KKH72_09900 [Alphaproteobacteria bacterium]|nr:hypothetical protein [Alphaproteobacteria bacterium]
MTPARFLVALTGAGLALSLGACTWDYMQHTDKVGYAAGDAVKANLEAETINPNKSTTYKKTGLGTNGDVIPAEDGAAAAGTPVPQP